MNLAVIPARGGSKRIPRKNIREFCGKPMIAWSIEAAQSSGCFDRVVISTDDEEIAEVASSLGAEVPFMRPDALSDDQTGTLPVIAHAIEQSCLGGSLPEFVCCIYATAPFIQGEDVLRGLNMLREQDAEYVFSATSYEFPIWRAIKLSKKGNVEMFYPEHFNTRSQDLEEAYHDAGQFYWGQTSAWLTQRQLFTPRSLAITLPRSRVQDIDTSEDWERAEAMFRALAGVRRADG